MPGTSPASQCRPQKINFLKNCIINPRSRSANEDRQSDSKSELSTINSSKNSLKIPSKESINNTATRRKGSCPQEVLIGSNLITPVSSTWTNQAETQHASGSQSNSNNEQISTRQSQINTETESAHRMKMKKVREESMSSVGVPAESPVSVSQPPRINLIQDLENSSCFPQEEMKRFLMEIFMRSVSAASYHGGCGQQFLVDQLGSSNCTDFGISDYLTEKGAVDDDGTETEAERLVLDVPPHRFSDSELSEGSIEPMSVTLDTILNVEPQLRDLTMMNVSDEGSVKTHRNYEETDKGESISNPYRCSKYPMKPKPFCRHISLPAPHFMALTQIEASPKSGSTGLLLQNNFKRRYLTRQYNKLMNRLASISVENILLDDDSGKSISTSSLGKLLQRAYSMSQNNSSWSSSRSTSISIDDFRELGLGDFDAKLSLSNTEIAFTTQLEREAITMRNLRRLRRQDTMRNFAPADFCNA